MTLFRLIRDSATYLQIDEKLTQATDPAVVEPEVYVQLYGELESAVDAVLYNPLGFDLGFVNGSLVI